MTVSELIKKLQEYPQDLKVFYVGEYCADEITTIYTQAPHPDYDAKDVIVLTDNK